MGEMEQSAKEVVLTYETLYETLRRERSREELQKLDEDFFASVLEYLREKQQHYDESLTKDDVFSQSEREKLQIQLANIRKILKDLYDSRERKIIQMAINKSRTKTNIIDTSTLLPEEKSLYESMNAVLRNNRQDVLERVVQLRNPDVLIASKPKVETPIEEPSADKEPVEVGETSMDKKQVKFSEEVEEFAGEDLQLYGPYKQDDAAFLPEQVAKVLINQGKAVEQP